MPGQLVFVKTPELRIFVLLYQKAVEFFSKFQNKPVIYIIPIGPKSQFICVFKKIFLMWTLLGDCVIL